MRNEDWHLNTERTNKHEFCFESDDDEVVFVPTSITQDESIARAIASEILYNRHHWFERGINAGREIMAHDLRSLLNAAPLEP